MNVITESEDFYGYIIGLQVERYPHPGPDSPVGSKLFATFEYRGKTSVWEVPDADLFRLLSRHLVDMAVSRTEVDEYGYSKLVIKKEHGRWHVNLP
jgi:hypothetical protein